MKKIPSHIILFTFLLLFPQAARDLHYLFFHHHPHVEPSGETAKIGEQEIPCPYKHVQFTPMEFVGLAKFLFRSYDFQFIFLKYWFSFSLKKLLPYDLRAPPDTNVQNFDELIK